MKGFYPASVIVYSTFVLLMIAVIMNRIGRDIFSPLKGLLCRIEPVLEQPGSYTNSFRLFLLAMQQNFLFTSLKRKASTFPFHSIASGINSS
jgi:hypothetical protein